METNLREKERKKTHLRFEPTYKEWKLSGGFLFGLGGLGFEPTYKEWKHITGQIIPDILEMF